MPTYKVQKLVAVKGNKRPGASKSIGAVWQTIAVKTRKAVAERIATHARIDNPDNQIRIEERS